MRGAPPAAHLHPTGGAGAGARSAAAAAGLGRAGPVPACAARPEEAALPGGAGAAPLPLPVAPNKAVPGGGACARGGCGRAGPGGSVLLERSEAGARRLDELDRFQVGLWGFSFPPFSFLSVRASHDRRSASFGRVWVPPPPPAPNRDPASLPGQGAPGFRKCLASPCPRLGCSPSPRRMRKGAGA